MELLHQACEFETDLLEKWRRHELSRAVLLDGYMTVVHIRRYRRPETGCAFAQIVGSSGLPESRLR